MTRSGSVLCRAAHTGSAEPTADLAEQTGLANDFDVFGVFAETLVLIG